MASACDVQTHGPLDLPTELWIEFTNRLEAVDILSLCATCKTLHLLLSQRSVWISILRSLSGQDDIYFPSYDLGDMDVEELRRAAMGPHRWGQLLEQNCLEPHPQALHNPPILQPASGPTKLPSTVLGPGEVDAFNYGLRVLLIPGGRYLMVADIHFIRLLDLGVPGRAPLSSPIEVAKVVLDRFDELVRHKHLFALGYDSGGLRVAVGIEPNSGDFFVVKVYSISPTDKNPEFKILGSLTLVNTSDERNSRWQIRGHQSKLLLDLENGSLGILWDFESGRYAAIFRHVRYARYESVTDDFVARFTEDALGLWPIPPLSFEVPPDGCVQLPDSENAAQEKMFPYPFRDAQVPRNPQYLLHTSCLQRLIPFPVALDVFPRRNAHGNTESSRYLVDVTKPDPEDPNSLDVTFTLQTMYCLPWHLHGLTLVGDQTPLKLGYPSKTLVVTDVWMAPLPYTRYLSVLSVMTPPGLGSRSNRAVERRATGKNVALTFLGANRGYYGPLTVYSLCSTSGRLVYLDKEGDVTPRLFVVDYLSI